MQSSSRTSPPLARALCTVRDRLFRFPRSLSVSSQGFHVHKSFLIIKLVHNYCAFPNLNLIFVNFSSMQNATDRNCYRTIDLNLNYYLGEGCLLLLLGLVWWNVAKIIERERPWWTSKDWGHLWVKTHTHTIWVQCHCRVLIICSVYQVEDYFQLCNYDDVHCCVLDICFPWHIATWEALCEFYFSHQAQCYHRVHICHRRGMLLRASVDMNRWRYSLRKTIRGHRRMVLQLAPRGNVIHGAANTLMQSTEFPAICGTQGRLCVCDWISVDH